MERIILITRKEEPCHLNLVENPFILFRVFFQLQVNSVSRTVSFYLCPLQAISTQLIHIYYFCH